MYWVWRKRAIIQLNRSPKSKLRSPKSKPTWGTRGRTQYGITREGFISFWEWNHYQSITSSFFFNRIRAPMGSTAAAAEKSEEELRREIDELLRQQRQVSSFSLSLFQKLSILPSLSLSLSLSLILFFNLKKKKSDNGASSRSSWTPQGRLFRHRPSQPRRQRTSSAWFPSTRTYSLFVSTEKKKFWKEFDFWFIYLFGFQADRTDSDGQPPAKRRLSSAVVKVTKKTKHPLFRWWEFRKVTIWSYDVLLCCLWFDDKWVK